VVITSGGHTAAVQVIDNYADQAITHGANQWSPTDLLDPGKFAPAIGKGKVYQHGRNYGWSLLDGVPSEFPKTNANQVTLGDGTVLPAYPAKENPEDPIPDALPWTTSPCPAGWALPTDAQAKTIPDVCQNIAGVTIDGLPFRTAGGLHILEQNIEEGGSKSNRAEMWTKEGGANLNSNAVNFKQSCYARTVYKGLWVRCIKEE
jgi:hypothetical protein